MQRSAVSARHQHHSISDGKIARAVGDLNGGLAGLQPAFLYLPEAVVVRRVDAVLEPDHVAERQAQIALINHHPLITATAIDSTRLRTDVHIPVFATANRFDPHVGWEGDLVPCSPVIAPDVAFATRRVDIGFRETVEILEAGFPAAVGRQWPHSRPLVGTNPIEQATATAATVHATGKRLNLAHVPSAGPFSPSSRNRLLVIPALNLLGEYLTTPVNSDTNNLAFPGPGAHEIGVAVHQSRDPALLGVQFQFVQARLKLVHEWPRLVVIPVLETDKEEQAAIDDGAVSNPRALEAFRVVLGGQQI